MALQNCPECNHQVSSEAVECPNCGHPINGNPVIIETKQTAPARNYGWGAFIYLIIIVAGLVMLLQGQLTGIFLLIIGVVLVIALAKRWSQSGKDIK